MLLLKVSTQSTIYIRLDVSPNHLWATNNYILELLILCIFKSNRGIYLNYSLCSTNEHSKLIKDFYR